MSDQAPNEWKPYVPDEHNKPINGLPPALPTPESFSAHDQVKQIYAGQKDESKRFERFSIWWQGIDPRSRKWIVGITIAVVSTVVTLPFLGDFGNLSNMLGGF